MIENHHFLHLKNRNLIEVIGEDSEYFLNNLITTDLEKIGEHEIYAGALLSPQGKVLFDFLIGKTRNGFVIDIDAPLVDGFKKRLLLYKLRSKVEIIESLETVITVSWKVDSACSDFDSCFTDKRFPDNANVRRMYSKSSSPAPTENDDWTRLRISYGVAESGADFELGDVFPHDINYDQTGGLSFTKGCYIGQEVVSRMHHRSTARRRMIIVKSTAPLLPHAKIEANGKPIGQLGSVIGHDALALARIDKVKMAMDKNESITVDNMPIQMSIAENMHYTFPENNAEGE